MTPAAMQADLSELTSEAETLLEASNDVRFELGRVLSEAKKVLGRSDFVRWRSEVLGTESTSWTSELLSVYEAFPNPEDRHLEKSWSAHREALRHRGYILKDGRELTCSEILDEFGTVKAIRNAGLENREPRIPTKRLGVDFIVRLIEALTGATDEAPTLAIELQRILGGS